MNEWLPFCRKPTGSASLQRCSQLANAVGAVRDGTVPALFPSTAKIYPVVVVPDPSLETFGINTFLNDVFQTFITDKNVKPLTLMSVQEFEDVLQACRDAQVSWPELLESRYDGSRVRFGSVHQALYNIRAARQAAHVPNEFRNRQFEEIYRMILARYKGE
jgi:hypothetical protein